MEHDGCTRTYCAACEEFMQLQNFNTWQVYV